MFNTTTMVLVLIAVLAVLHGLRVLLPEQWSLVLSLAAGFAPSNFLVALSTLLQGAADPFNDLRPLILASPLTHALLHADFFHLGLNMAFLLAFGTAVDRHVGSARFLALFVLSVLGGALLALVVYLVTGDPVVMIGASGGVSGLFGAYVRFGMRQRIAAIAIFVGINVVMAFTGIVSLGEVQQVAWYAHLGGFFAGYFLLPLFARGRPSGS